MIIIISIWFFILRFNDMNGLMSQRDFVLVSRKLFERIYFLCNSTRDGFSSSVTFDIHSINTRIINVAYPIAFSPRFILEEMGWREKSLQEAAVALVLKYHAMVMHIASAQSFHDVLSDSSSSFSCASFPVLCQTYFECYITWKDTEKVKTFNRIRRALDALYHSERIYPLHDTDFTENRTQIRNQIEILRSRMQQSCGVSALLEFDQRRGDGVDTAVSEHTSESFYFCNVLNSDEAVVHELLVNPALCLEDYRNQFMPETSSSSSYSEDDVSSTTTTFTGIMLSVSGGGGRVFCFNHSIVIPNDSLFLFFRASGAVFWMIFDRMSLAMRVC